MYNIYTYVAIMLRYSEHKCWKRINNLSFFLSVLQSKNTLLGTFLL